MNAWQLFELLLIPIHAFGILCAVEALYLTRSSQSAIAWCLTLIIFPYLALPIYLVFGRTRFKGYREIQHQLLKDNQKRIDRYQALLQDYRAATVPLEASSEKLYEQIAGEEFTDGNAVNLLINGSVTFKEIFRTLEGAQSFILVQFYIIRADEIGRELQRRLIECAQKGVKVCLLYDEIGSSDLSESYLAELRAAGVEAYPFATRQGPGNFFQFNFRNHRKIVVVDGHTAFVGGPNVGDEYIRGNKRLGAWRDTNIKLEGPAVLPLHAMFIADWTWATKGREAPKTALPKNFPANYRVLPIPTGPADEKERCTLLFLQAINSARSRLWIASPYLVPGEALQRALQLAALRGVDVRILVPNKSDHYLVGLASFYYTPELVNAGVRIFRYNSGFTHQKVMLVDDTLAIVGTVNLDNRSFHLNFEISVLVANRSFCEKTADMLKVDFGQSTEDTTKNFEQYSLSRRLLSKFARLFSPAL